MRKYFHSMLLSLILTFAILSGQLIRITVGGGGVTALDIFVIILNCFALYKLKFHLKKPPPIILAAFFFIVATIVSLVLSPLYLKFNEYLNSSFYIVRLSLYILFTWVIFSNAFPTFRKQVATALSYSGVSLAILGLLQFMFLPDLSFLTIWGWDPHYFRTVSSFLDPNFAGAYFVLTMLLILSLQKPKFLFIPVFLALLTTFSRSSYLMFLLSGLTLSFFEKSKKIMIKVILLFLVLLAGFQIYTQVISKPRNIDREKSASFRLNTWQQGLTLFQKYPFLGVGFNTYRYALSEFNLGDEQFIKSHGSSSNDSSLLFVAVTTGIIGLLVYIWFIVSILKVGLKENFVLASSISGLLIHSIFANSLFFPPIFLWLMLISTTPKE